jgi:hypothetical protein
MKLPPVSFFNIPKFKLFVQEINYTWLLCKAMYVHRHYEGFMPGYLPSRVQEVPDTPSEVTP